MPDQLREQAAMISGCITGAERINRLEEILVEIGFEAIRILSKSHSCSLVSSWFPGSGAENYMASAGIEAFKPL